MSTEPTPSHLGDDCGQWEADLKAYHDRELPWMRHSAVQRHLEQCAACREELNLMQQITNQMQDAEAAETKPLDPALRHRIIDAARTVEAPRTVPSRPAAPRVPEPRKPERRARSFWLSWEAGAALTGTVLCIMVILTVMGQKLKGGFSAAANQISTSAGGESYSPPMLARSTPSDNVEVAERERSQVAQRRAVEVPIYANGRHVRTEIVPQDGGETSPFQRRVHKEGRMAVAVEDVEQQGETVETLVKSVNGFLLSNSITTGANGLKAANLEIRVPVDSFEDMVRKISKLGNVRDKNIAAQDVTGRFLGAQARRDTLGNEYSIREAQLRRLEAQAKKTNSSWMRAEVRRIRAEANAARAQFEYIKRTTDIANLQVTLEEKTKTAKAAGFSETLGQTGREAWASFLATARLPIQLLIWLVAYSPFWLPAIFLWRRYATGSHHTGTS